MTATIHTDAIGLAALILVAAAWVIFALIFLLRKKPPATRETKRAPAARIGIIMQGIAFGLVWSLRRSHWWPWPAFSTGELLLAVAAVVLAWASCWWCWRAVQTLGKQWTFQARVIEGHELVTIGPYAIVRNPIYLGMFGIMIATGLVLATWWAQLAAITVFLIGNWIRIHQEEKLLREAFGSRFEEYAQRVPAFLPGVW